MINGAVKRKLTLNAGNSHTEVLNFSSGVTNISIAHTSDAVTVLVKLDKAIVDINDDEAIHLVPGLSIKDIVKSYSFNDVYVLASGDIDIYWDTTTY